MLKIALLTLSLTSDGDIRLTLSESDTVNDCEQSRAIVTDILTGAGIEVIAAVCGETALQLTPFEHGASAEDEKHKYRAELGSDHGFTVTPLADGEVCTSKPDGNPAIYCARSSQRVIAGN